MSKKVTLERAIDPNSPEGLEEFRQAMKTFDSRVNRTAATARAQLVKEGIYTKTGRLTKRYR